MAGFIDYRHIMEPSAMPEAAQSIDAAATVLLQKRAAEQHQQRQLELQREVETRKMAWQEGLAKQHEDRQKLADTRFRSQQELENTKARQSTDDKIRAAAGNRDFARAQGISDNYAEVDPGTGEMRKGRGFKVQERDVGPEPVDPALHLERPTPTTDPARLKLETESALQDHETMQRHSREVSGWQSEKTKAKANPQVTIGETTTTPDELRLSAAQTEASDMERIIGSRFEGDPEGAAYAATLSDAVRGGGMSKEKAIGAVDQYLRTGMKQDFQAGENQLNRENALERQRLANQRPMAGIGMQERRLGFSERKEQSANLRKDVKALVTQFNAKTTQEAAFEFPNIIKMLESGNGRLQNQALITMMRLAQKDNRFSDADAKLAMQTGAGWLEQVEDWASKGATGKLGSGVVDKARRAASVLHGHYTSKAKAMNEEAMSLVQQPDFYNPAEAEQLLRRELPGFGQSLEERGIRTQPAGGAPAKRRAPVVPEAGHSKSADPADQLLDGLRKILGN